MKKILLALVAMVTLAGFSSAMASHNVHQGVHFGYDHCQDNNIYTCQGSHVTDHCTAATYLQRSGCGIVRHYYKYSGEECEVNYLGRRFIGVVDDNSHCVARCNDQVMYFDRYVILIR